MSDDQMQSKCVFVIQELQEIFYNLELGKNPLKDKLGKHLQAFKVK